MAVLVEELLFQVLTSQLLPHSAAVVVADELLLAPMGHLAVELVELLQLELAR
jgi:hypothetical protein